MTGIPERLGKYPVSGVLGKGAMGIVYRGVDPVIRRPVAIKTIHRSLIEDEDKVEMLAGRFRKEAQAAGALNHPGIVSVYEYGEDADYAFIAMECVEGNSLREYFARGTRFDEHDALAVISQLLDALSYAHDHAVWHRDVKPANIIVMSNGRIKLTDFGIARIEASDRTHTNLLMGTPGYIAPENYLGQQTDHRADVFSAGVVFYQLLTGQAPFRGTPEAIMHSVCYLDPDPPSKVQPRLRAVFDPIVARALMKRPEDRFPSAGAFLNALQAIYDAPISESISEQTIITEVARPAAADAGGTQRTTASTQATSATPPPTGWDAPALAAIERELARVVGPVARVLVRRAAREHKTLETLAPALLEHLPGAKERDAFLAKVLGRGTTMFTLTRTTDVNTTGTRGTNPARPDAAPAVEELERITKVLTGYVGPIAKVIVRRTAGDGIGRRALLESLAAHIPAEADRDRFLREVG